MCDSLVCVSVCTCGCCCCMLLVLLLFNFPAAFVLVVDVAVPVESAASAFSFGAPPLAIAGLLRRQKRKGTLITKSARAALSFTVFQFSNQVERGGRGVSWVPPHSCTIAYHSLLNGNNTRTHNHTPIVHCSAKKKTKDWT